MAQLSTAVLPKDTSKGKGVECSIPVEKADGSTSQVRLRVRDPGFSGTSELRTEAELAQEYLTEHRLQARLQELIQDVLRVQPENPYRHMLQSLRSQPPSQGPPAHAPAAGGAEEAAAAEAAAAAVAQTPLLPRPPSGPSPGGAGPRKARQVAAADQARASPGAAGAGRTLGQTLARQEAKEAGRASISLLYTSSAVVKRPSKVSGPTTEVLAEAKAACRGLYSKAVLLCSWEYRRAAARYSVATLIRGSVARPEA